MKTMTLFDGTEIEGVELASVSSWSETKLRWVELALYRTIEGTYVLDGVGRSDIDGETDRPWWHEEEDPAQLVTHLHIRDRATGRKFMPRVNEQLLEKASVTDATVAARVRHALSVVV